MYKGHYSYPYGSLRRTNSTVADVVLTPEDRSPETCKCVVRHTIISTLHKERDKRRITLLGVDFEVCVPALVHFCALSPHPTKHLIFQSCKMICHFPLPSNKMSLEFLYFWTLSKLIPLPRISFGLAFPSCIAHPSSSYSMARSPEDFPDCQVRIHLFPPYTPLSDIYLLWSALFSCLKISSVARDQVPPALTVWSWKSQRGGEKHLLYGQSAGGMKRVR